VSTGGTIGYVKAGSKASLIAGGTIGFLYALGAYRIQNRLSYGAEIALLASLVLAGNSIPKALRSGKPVSVGLSVLAVVGLWKFGGAVLNART
jgi:uncharacterized membrane protein (UPF0136 family)